MWTSICIQKFSDFFHIFTSSDERSCYIVNSCFDSKQKTSFVLFNKRWKFNFHTWQVKMSSRSNFNISADFYCNMIFKNLNYFCQCSSRIYNNLISYRQISNNIWIITIDIRILTKFWLIHIDVENFSFLERKWSFSNTSSNIWSLSIQKNRYIEFSLFVKVNDLRNQITSCFRSCMSKVNSHNIYSSFIQLNNFFNFIIVSYGCNDFCKLHKFKW